MKDNFERLLNFIRRIILSPEKYARSCGVKIGKHCRIDTKKIPWAEAYLIEIGDYVRIAPYTKFFTHGGLWSQRKKHPELLLEHFGKIKIGNYTYIGECCMIMPGVTIGSDVIVGGGSVVTKSIPDGVMIAGNPAKIIGRTEDFIKRVSENPSIESKSFYDLNNVDKAKYIKNIPEEKLIRKGYIK
jgi:acetyltransferase-like isoleucine patch superfamily enzyme